MGRKKTIKFEEDFEGVLFGIVTQLKDYRLCWHINAALGFDLIRMNDLEIIHKKKNKTAVFSLFRYENDLDKFLIYLVSNKYQGEHFLSELRQADFLFVIHGEVNDIRRNEFLSLLKNIAAIQLVTLLDASRIKSKENLVFE